MIDAVLSYHLSPYGCGTAKWNLRLARELGVPCLPFGRHTCQHPLISVRAGELPYGWDEMVKGYPQYDLFLHDDPLQSGCEDLLPAAIRVYAANQVIARMTRRWRPDVIEAWCPSTIETPQPRADLTILTFGMAHKLVSPYYKRLRDLLDAHGEPYTILVSTAVHEGHPWDEALQESAAALQRIFGMERVEMLGFLSDAALDREIRAAWACAAFYMPALRANNTTAWAVLERGRSLVTNCDVDTPSTMFLQYDINRMQQWSEVRQHFLCQGSGGWADLIEFIQKSSACAS